MDMEYNTEWYREYRLCPAWDRGFLFRETHIPR